MWNGIFLLLISALCIGILVLLQRDRDDKKNS